MPAQVTQWIYENMDWAFAADQTFHYSKTANTLNDIFKIVSCTPQLPNKSLIYDHAVDNNYGLIVRPVTGYLPNNAGTGTGVFDFTITETQDNKWKVDENAIYGQIRIDDLIPMVWQACGLNVAESWQSTYLTRCRRHLIPGRSVCNAHITNNVGTCCLYVRKRVIDEIIEAMDVEGMFDVDQQLPDLLPAGEITMGAGGSFTQAFNYCVSNMQSGVWSDLTANYPYYEGFTISPQRAMADIGSMFASHGINISDYKYGFISAGYQYPVPGYPLTKTVYLYLYNITDDSFTLYSDVESSIPTGSTGKNFSITNSNIRQRADGNCYSGYISYSFSKDTETGVITITPTEHWNDISNIPQNLCAYRQNYKDEGNIYRVWAEMTNWMTEEIRPEGITVKEDATPGETGTTTSDFWSSWAASSISLQTVSVDTFDFDTATFIPIGYGSSTSDYTQYDMQHGKIKGKPYLQALGVVMEDIEDFLPVVYDPDDPDDPSNPPIINPDTQPESTPTPTDESSASESASRLFTVHKLSNTEVDALGNFLYSNDFISAIQNMFTEPMDAIIGCFILHYHGTLPLGANETLRLGSILGTSGVTGDKVTNQYMDIDFGSITIPEFYGNVEDYAPYSKAEIFLPYIGFCAIDVNDVMGASVKLKYTIDIFTGACVARIFVTKNGTTQEVYNFNGNCAAMVPLTNRDFTQGVSHLLTGAVGIIGGIASGGATGVLSATVGASHLMGSPVGTKRSGSVGSNLGAMSNQTPFIMIHRPRAYNAANWPYFYGQPSWWSTTLGRLSGYTRVKEAHLDGIDCTDDERREIERLLKQGVMV